MASLIEMLHNKAKYRRRLMEPAMELNDRCIPNAELREHDVVCKVRESRIFLTCNLFFVLAGDRDSAQQVRTF